MDKAQMERIMVGEHAEVQYTLLLELVAEGRRTNPSNTVAKVKLPPICTPPPLPAPSPCTLSFSSKGNTVDF